MRANGEDVLKVSRIILNTAKATEEFLETSCTLELDRVFGTVLEKLNVFFRRVERSFKDFVVFERYVTCAYTREEGYSLRDIPEEVKERVYDLRDNDEVCGFTGKECICKKSFEFFKSRFTEKISAMMSSGDFLRSESDRLKKNMENLGTRVESLTDIARKIMNIAELIEIIALNAYIEAARLGDQGRSFKVIADEVRRASVKTNELASEIVESIKNLQKSFQDQMEVHREFHRSMENLEKEQTSFSEDLNRDLLWMAQNFIDFLEYMRTFVKEDMDLLGDVRNTIMSVLQTIDLTNQRVGNTAKALSILADMIGEFEKLVKGEKELEEVRSRIESLYEDFRKIPKLREEREIIARTEGRGLETGRVGEKIEDLETDVELF
ncbi:MAG: methyl-accepting chemotaxis protein [Aquificota bacterium]|nr:methyl-accepting chemotaxis protein [Aquificota bacterium]